MLNSIYDGAVLLPPLPAPDGQNNGIFSFDRYPSNCFSSSLYSFSSNCGRSGERHGSKNGRVSLPKQRPAVTFDFAPPTSLRANASVSSPSSCCSNSRRLTCKGNQTASAAQRTPWAHTIAAVTDIMNRP